MEKIFNEEDFDRLIDSHPDELVVIKFGANWCSPCKLLGKIIEDLQPVDGAVFAEVNVDDADEDFVNENNIRSIPAVFFYKNGLLVDKFVGMIGAEEFENKIGKYLI